MFSSFLFNAKTLVGKLNAIFLTHMHSDPNEGLANMKQLQDNLPQNNNLISEVGLLKMNIKLPFIYIFI